MCNAAPENCSGAPLTRLPDWDRAKGATDRVPRKLSQNLRLQNSKENKKWKTEDFQRFDNKLQILFLLRKPSIKPRIFTKKIIRLQFP